MKVFKFCCLIILSIAVLVSCGKKMTADEYYSKAQELYSNEKPKEAFDHFKQLVENFPKAERHPDALFMMGYIKANDLKEFEEAGGYYKTFLEKYPEHELADDAQYEINNLGKDLNEQEIIKKLSGDTLSQ